MHSAIKHKKKSTSTSPQRERKREKEIETHWDVGEILVDCFLMIFGISLSYNHHAMFAYFEVHSLIATRSFCMHLDRRITYVCVPHCIINQLKNQSCLITHHTKTQVLNYEKKYSFAHCNHTTSSLCTPNTFWSLSFSAST